MHPPVGDIHLFKEIGHDLSFPTRRVASRTFAVSCYHSALDRKSAAPAGMTGMRLADAPISSGSAGPPDAEPTSSMRATNIVTPATAPTALGTDGLGVPSSAALHNRPGPPIFTGTTAAASFRTIRSIAEAAH
jgi:hypothetical protein